MNPLHLLCLSAVVHLGATAECRDRYLEPFSSSSIWNTAIGSDAVFAAADLFPIGRLPSQFHNDQDFMLRVTDADPMTPWINQGDWGGDDHCTIQGAGTVVSHINFPENWTSASDCTLPDGTYVSKNIFNAAAAATENVKFDAGAGVVTCRSQANQPNNNAMGVLLPDNETLVQMQPAYRCKTGASEPLLARFGNGSADGCPQQFPNVTSIFGDGALGSHGGSGLSGVGGTIRVTELLNSTGPIPHALKIELQHQWYYGLTRLQPATDYNGGRGQYVWPATGSDGGSNKAPGGLYGGTDKNVAPGALLAIPAGTVAASVHVTTVVGAKIKQAMVDYGAYIVDDTGAGNSVAVCMESDVNAEMRRAYGYAMTYPHGVSAAPADRGNMLYADLLAIFRALHVVTNNKPTSVGGGGAPRVPTKAPICGAPL